MRRCFVAAKVLPHSHCVGVFLSRLLGRLLCLFLFQLFCRLVYARYGLAMSLQANEILGRTVQVLEIHLSSLVGYLVWSYSL